MKKKHLQRHIDSLARQIEILQGREEQRRTGVDSRFESAMHDLKTGADVLVVTASGHLLRAAVTEVRSDVDMIDISDGTVRSFMPGLRTLRVQLEPKPGLFDE